MSCSDNVDCSNRASKYDLRGMSLSFFLVSMCSLNHLYLPQVGQRDCPLPEDLDELLLELLFRDLLTVVVVVVVIVCFAIRCYLLSVPLDIIGMLTRLVNVVALTFSSVLCYSCGRCSCSFCRELILISDEDAGNCNIGQNTDNEDNSQPKVFLPLGF